MRNLLMLLAACRGYHDPPTDTTSASPGAQPPILDIAPTDAHVSTSHDEGSRPPTSDTGPACRYPSRPTEPMTEGEVLAPYRWERAQHMNGTLASLELGKVPCDIDDDIDWSPFDVLVFVSIPAW